MTNFKKTQILIFIILTALALFFFLKRIVYLDGSFDTVNYHFFLGMEGVTNFPLLFKSSEFYPLGIHSFSPLVDSVGYISYLLLGYRAGVLLSFLSTISIFVLGLLILDNFIKDKLSENNLWVYPFLTIPIFVINELFFQVSTYFTDNLYSFLLILYLFFLFKLASLKSEKFFKWIIVSLGIIMGLIITKLTNLIYAIPLLFSTIYFIINNKIYKNNKIRTLLVILLVFAIFIMLINYHLFLNLFQTTNPVFPFYNSIFKSIYFPLESWSFNFGPGNLIERILYPFYAINNPIMLGEVKDMFPDVKLLIILFFNILLTIFLKIKKINFEIKEKTILFIFFSSFFLWQFLFGYSRYGIFLEIIGGVLSVILILKFMNFKKNNRYIMYIISSVFVVFMIFLSVKIIKFNIKYDIAWRPSPTTEEWVSRIKSKNFFAKYTFINEDLKNKLKNTEIVIQCVNPSSLYFSTIKELKYLPLVNIDRGYNILLNQNINYINKRDDLLFKSFNKKDINFVAVFNDHGGPDGGVSREKCLNAIRTENLQKEKIILKEEFSIDNFLGDRTYGLVLFTGVYKVE